MIETYVEGLSIIEELTFCVWIFDNSLISSLTLRMMLYFITKENTLVCSSNIILFNMFKRFFEFY